MWVIEQYRYDRVRDTNGKMTRVKTWYPISNWTLEEINVTQRKPIAEYANMKPTLLPKALDWVERLHVATGADMMDFRLRNVKTGEIIPGEIL